MAILLDKHVAEHPDRPALVDESGSTTWSELKTRVTRLSRAFADRGIGSGDTIVVMMGNRREIYEVLLAAAHTGFTVVPVNWHWVADELAYVIDDSGARALIVDERFVEIAEVALADERSNTIEFSAVAGPGSLDAYEDLVASGSDEPLEEQLLGGPMFYTSGTTGRPKGVRGMLSGGQGIPSEIFALICSSMDAYVPASGTTLLAGPAYHSAQWAFSFMPLVNGSTVVMRHKYDAAETLRLIDEYEVTNVHLVPTQFKRMLDLDEAVRSSFDGSSLTAMWHGAAPCPAPWKRAMIDWIGPVVHEYYGSTEGAFISVIHSPDWLEKGGSVGRPLESMEVFVVDDDGNHLEANKTGTLYFKSAMGSDFEYHNDPEKTAEAHLEPGVFTTGDVGHIDDDGYLWLSDRKIDMIISGGVNIYPAEIEAVLADHPAVSDVAVIGVPNEEFGEEVKAIVQLSDGGFDADGVAAALLAACSEKLAGYKRPRSVDFIDEMPRTGTGKILKRELREPYWADSGRAI
ncbi:MAG: long-chain acyl-CoA synthetase [Candidatus Aldehydirespiratoraceae bacterium]|jgi:long-chain acyl-CoA synthetase